MPSGVDVVLGAVVAVEAGAVVGLDQLEPVLVERGERPGVAVDVVEDAEFQGISPFTCPACADVSCTSLSPQAGRGERAALSTSWPGLSRPSTPLVLRRDGRSTFAQASRQPADRQPGRARRGPALPARPRPVRRRRAARRRAARRDPAQLGRARPHPRHRRRGGAEAARRARGASPPPTSAADPGHHHAAGAAAGIRSISSSR